MKLRSFPFIAAAIFLVNTTISYAETDAQAAEVETIPVDLTKEPVESSEPVPAKVAGAKNLPKRGDISQEVLLLIGQPVSVTPPVGDPAISSWVYTDYIVYFEDGKVLHSFYIND